MMTEQRLRELLGRLGELRIAVVGDLFLDRWWEVDRTLDEPSVETGLTSYQVVGVRKSAGAAGTVLGNLSDLGVGTLYAVGLVGDDGEGYELERLLRQKRVDLRYLVKSAEVFTPTYTKPMFFSVPGEETEDHRFDIKNYRRTPRELEDRLIVAMRAAAKEAQALVVLDQLTYEDTGVVTGGMRRALAALAAERPDPLILADSRSFADRFSGVVIKCNDKEAREMVLGAQGDFSLEELSACQRELSRRAGRPAVVTCGAHGVLVEDGGVRLAPALPVEGEIDVCGCGDACTAGLVSALCAGASPTEAAELGNLCAAVTIRKLGTTGTASPAEVLARYRAAFGEEGGL